MKCPKNVQITHEKAGKQNQRMKTMWCFAGGSREGVERGVGGINGDGEKRKR